jgi:type-F conjugative transfer system pilin assembly protein TrbC
MKKILFSLIFLLSANAYSQTVFESMAYPQQMTGYIFVSSKMPDAFLISIAAEASKAGMALVLNGYQTPGPHGLEITTRRIVEINEACCGERGATWMINPMLYERYKVASIPAFVIAQSESADPASFSKVGGEMSVINALKFIYQNSQIPSIKKKAGEIYRNMSINQ